MLLLQLNDYANIMKYLKKDACALVWNAVMPPCRAASGDGLVKLSSCLTKYFVQATEFQKRRCLADPEVTTQSRLP